MRESACKYWATTLNRKITTTSTIRDEQTIQMWINEVNNYDKKQAGYKRFLLRLIFQKLRAKRWESKRRAAGWKTREEFLEEKEKNGVRVNHD